MLYISSVNNDSVPSKIYAYDLDNNQLSTLISSGLSEPRGLAISPDGNTLYVADPGQHKVFAYDIGTDTLSTLFSSSNFVPVGLALSPDGGTLYVSNSDVNTVLAYEIGTNTLSTLISSGLFSPYGIALNTAGTILYIANSGNVSVAQYVIADATHIATELIPAGPILESEDLAVSPDDNTLYVTDGGANIVWAYHIGGNTLSQLISSGLNEPFGIVGTSDGNTLYIANFSVGPQGSVDAYDIGGSSLSTLIASGIDRPLFLALNRSPAPPPPPSPSSSSPSSSSSSSSSSSKVHPPRHLKGHQQKNDFAMEYALVNVLRWQASKSSIAGYYVYRNGKKIATLSASTLQYEDHNRKQGAKTRYSVTAFESSGKESTPINTTIH
jgi:sugar lactone lactonase YvrE